MPFSSYRRRRCTARSNRRCRRRLLIRRNLARPSLLLPFFLGLPLSFFLGNQQGSFLPIFLYIYEKIRIP
jgi:hypothetical protein